jgi:hypothetical protein
MIALTFDILNRAWNKVKTEKITQLKALVPGLSDPTKIYLKRVDDDGSSMTIEFKNIETSVSDPMRDIPLMKRAILGWLQKLSSDVQIVRGETPSLIVKVGMASDLPSFGDSSKQMSATKNPVPKYEQDPDLQRDLTNIIRKKAVT